MYLSDAMLKIIEELEFLEAEQRQIRERGPHFKIVHRYSEPFASSGALEEISAVYLVYGRKAVQVRLGATLSILFDYMARHNRLAQTARQIERGTRAGFRDGRLGKRPLLQDFKSGIARRYIRVYMDRIRGAVAVALQETGLDIEVHTIVVSQDTAINEVGYRLRGTFEWLHTA